MLKPLVPKIRPDLSACLKDIAEEQVPAKLKPILVDPPGIGVNLRLSGLVQVSQFSIYGTYNDATSY